MEERECDCMANWKDNCMANGKDSCSATAGLLADAAALPAMPLPVRPSGSSSPSARRRVVV